MRELLNQLRMWLILRLLPDNMKLAHLEERMPPGKVYRVDVGRDMKWWVIDVPELDITTQAERFDQVESYAKDVIALALDVADPSRVKVNIVLDDEEDT